MRRVEIGTRDQSLVGQRLRTTQSRAQERGYEERREGYDERQQGKPYRKKREGFLGELFDF